MAELSDSLFDFSDDIHKSFGFGNQNLLGIFIVAGLLSILAVGGYYLPALATLMNGLMTLTLGGGAFLGISVLSGLSLGGVIFGLITGVILASLATTLCSLMLFLAPPVAVVLSLPSIIAGISYALGGVISFFESCCSGITNDTEADYTVPSFSGEAQYLHQPASQLRRTDDRVPGGGAFFETRGQGRSTEGSYRAGYGDVDVSSGYSYH